MELMAFDAIAPLAKVFEWSEQTNSFLAIWLGIGFGFFLEKAGFGSSKVLAGVWYGYNFAVIRVMFTAIVVSMLGLVALHYLGIMNLDLLYINPTYLWPQIVGGVIFGFGFNMGQYCPGTSAVSAATGKIDGLVFIGGFIIGIFFFSLVYPLFAEFYSSSSMGRLMLSDITGIPLGVLALVITCIALGAFAFTHYLDKKLGNTK